MILILTLTLQSIIQASIIGPTSYSPVCKSEFAAQLSFLGAQQHFQNDQDDVPTNGKIAIYTLIAVYTLILEGTPRNYPILSSNASTTRFIQIRLELIAPSVFEVYETIQGIFPESVNNSNTYTTISCRAMEIGEPKIGNEEDNIAITATALSKIMPKQRKPNPSNRLILLPEEEQDKCNKAPAYSQHNAL